MHFRTIAPRNAQFPFFFQRGLGGAHGLLHRDEAQRPRVGQHGVQGRRQERRRGVGGGGRRQAALRAHPAQEPDLLL